MEYSCQTAFKKIALIIAFNYEDWEFKNIH
jgi:hypothetical protein